jgi:hypothetical protein
MRAQNLYNGAAIVGCRFAFTLPVDLPVRSDPAQAPAAADAAASNQPSVTLQ